MHIKAQYTVSREIKVVKSIEIEFFHKVFTSWIFFFGFTTNQGNIALNIIWRIFHYLSIVTIRNILQGQNWPIFTNVYKCRQLPEPVWHYTGTILRVHLQNWVQFWRILWVQQNSLPEPGFIHFNIKWITFAENHRRFIEIFELKLKLKHSRETHRFTLENCWKTLLDISGFSTTLPASKN